MTHKNAGLAAQIHPIDCPMCGQAVRVPTLEMVVHHYRLTPGGSRILGTLWKGKGLAVPTSRLLDALYADDINGGPSPTNMYAAFNIHLCRLRKALKGTGIAIVNAGYGRGWRLVFGEGN